MRVILLLSVSLLFYGLLLAEETPNLGDKLIASTFKTLAKTFVATADMNRLKKDNIRRLNKMDEAKFRKRYAKVYETIKGLPIQMRLKYGITEGMTREQAIRSIESVDKPDIYRLINSIPDTFIIAEFKQYLSRTTQQMQNSNLIAQVNKLWYKMTAKAESPSHKSPQYSHHANTLSFK
ncbi:hypothetical protein D4R78_02355 [bacterium]|nr:MAG: hypothetical protein D4R78_02355 [bacterium]